MENNQELNWNSAKEIAEENKIEAQQLHEKYQESLDDAQEEFWERLGDPDFNYEDFEDVCSEFGVDEDDLLFKMI